MLGPEMAMPNIERGEKEKLDEDLRQQAFSLAGLSENLQPKNLGAGSYAENQGVIVFRNVNGVYALPSSADIREKLQNAGYYNDNKAGVPWLNNADSWTKAQQGSFEEWKRLVG